MIRSLMANSSKQMPPEASRSAVSAENSHPDEGAATELRDGRPDTIVRLGPVSSVESRPSGLRSQKSSVFSLCESSVGRKSSGGYRPDESCISYGDSTSPREFGTPSVSEE